MREKARPDALRGRSPRHMFVPYTKEAACPMQGASDCFALGATIVTANTQEFRPVRDVKVEIGWVDEVGLAPKARNRARRRANELRRRYSPRASRMCEHTAVGESHSRYEDPQFERTGSVRVRPPNRICFERITPIQSSDYAHNANSN
jgi:hypothetical protein